jgi:spore coat polysaccharide biosynthesis protein SpsF
MEFQPAEAERAIEMSEATIYQLDQARRRRLEQEPGLTRTAVVVEAEMGSARLPGKALLPICGRSLLGHVVARMREVGGAEVAVVTTDSLRDAPVRVYCRRNGIEVFAGSERDPLDRLYRAAVRFGAETVVRVSASAAFLDPRIVEQLLRLHRESGSDVTRVAAGEGRISSEGGRYPSGFEAECVGFHALERAWSEATDLQDRRSVSGYLARAVGRFRVTMLRAERNLSHLRLTVEDENDLELARNVYTALAGGARAFSLDDVLEFLNDHPGLLGASSRFVEAESEESLEMAA